MSLRRHQPQTKSQLKIQLRSLQPSCNGNINGIASFQTRNNIVGNSEEYNTREPLAVASPVSSVTTVVPVAIPGTSTSVIPLGSATTTDAPAVTEQIANLLNLAQHLLSSVREQQQRQHRRRHRHQRESRLLVGTPYQRPNSAALATSQQLNDSNDNNESGISGTNVNTVSIGETCAVTNDGANSTGQQQLRHTKFCNGGSNSGTSEDNINFQCAICLNSYLLHRPMVTQCGHLFCKRCIRQCVSCQAKCPMCNRKLNSKSMFRVYF
ncbi:E3 ubiquitin-protein ligase RNF113A-like [Bactrocera tryoni]|uniref:E3 ubiquitin-protein ligase RNF113A-like n=1 Tax=Bactrocera tryoni TaxID=59916 RepID=UPI001A95DC27|nr:E3 ubiquitin-protein ligase RNF113A-like [Bactrocera tryoni]